MTTHWTATAAEARFAPLNSDWLEREYSPSSAINGNYQPYLAAYAQRSEAVCQALAATSTLGVRYGTRVRNIIDVFPAPSTDGSPAPALVFFHGGYWQESSLRDVSFPAAAINAAGMTYISVEYTLAPKATLTEIVEEARQAVKFILSNADRFYVDPNRVVLGGHSAGAHLAALTAAEVAISPRLLLISGIYELLPLLRTTINNALQLSPNEVATLSPVRNAPTCSGASVVWADNETAEFAWQSQLFAQELATRNPQQSLTTVVVSQRNHFDVILDLADRSTVLFSEVLKLVSNVD
jgi:arylformamidase